MTHRSWLFAPAHEPGKLEKLARLGADAVLLDLEDAVPPRDKAQARLMARDWLALHRSAIARSRPLGRYVRINPVGSPHWRDDLAMVMQAWPDGIVVPKVAGPEQLQPLVAEIYELEQRLRIELGSTRIVAMVGEDAACVLRIADFVQSAPPRLCALTWGSEDLAASLGATRRRDDAGEWAGLFRRVREEVLLAAKARGLWAIETIEPEFRDAAVFARSAGRAAADGFDGMLAIHPAQVEAINRAFAPSEAELARARAIVAAFNASPGAAALQVDGRMVERMHLVRAQDLLAREG